jgi:hypothetical protein
MLELHTHISAECTNLKINLLTIIFQKLLLLCIQEDEVLQSKQATYNPVISCSHSISRYLLCYMKKGRFMKKTDNVQISRHRKATGCQLSVRYRQRHYVAKGYHSASHTNVFVA